MDANERRFRATKINGRTIGDIIDARWTERSRELDFPTMVMLLESLRENMGCDLRLIEELDGTYSLYGLTMSPLCVSSVRTALLAVVGGCWL